MDVTAVMGLWSAIGRAQLLSCALSRHRMTPPCFSLHEGVGYLTGCAPYSWIFQSPDP
jgi:hypothetical protein